MGGLVLFLPSLTFAHGVGEVYNLPIPLKYYLTAAALAVAVSFLLFSFFAAEKKDEVAPEKVIPATWLKPLLKVLRVISLLFLVLLVSAGLFGNQNALENITPLFFWVGLIIGMSLLSLLCGNIWHKINPWKLLFEGVWGKSGYGSMRVSSWMGIALIFGLYWWELASGHSFLPKTVGTVLFLYTVLNLFLPRYFGNWFTSGELFSVYFGFIGKLSYFSIETEEKSFVLTPTAKRLKNHAGTWSGLILACLLLASTSFDSFKETVLWFKWLYGLGFAVENLVAIDTFGLILSPLPFLLLYLLVVWIMKRITNSPSSLELAKVFSFSLIPIAFGYTLAHSFSLVIVSLPQMGALISDPFGFGWDIFGTAGLMNTSLILGAKVIWFIEIGLVVLAHIVGTWYAHVLAVNNFSDRKTVIRSQYPMLVLMVAFTVTTLWLLSQPLVSR